MPELKIDPAREYQRWRDLHRENTDPANFAYQFVEIRNLYASKLHRRDPKWRAAAGWPTERQLLEALRGGTVPDGLLTIRKDIERVRRRLDTGELIDETQLEAVVALWSMVDEIDHRIVSGWLRR